jgi:hypothetical protein
LDESVKRELSAVHIDAPNSGNLLRIYIQSRVPASSMGMPFFLKYSSCNFSFEYTIGFECVNEIVMSVWPDYLLIVRAVLVFWGVY